MPVTPAQALRLSTAAACAAVAATVALAPLWSSTIDERALGPAVALGLGGVALTLVGLAGWAPGLGWAAFLLGAGYGVTLFGRGGTFDAPVIVVAPTLLLVTELGYWSLDARVAGASSDRRRRLAMVGGGGVVALVAAAAVATTMQLPPVGGLVAAAAGVAAAVSVVGVALLLARRRPFPS